MPRKPRGVPTPSPGPLTGAPATLGSKPTQDPPHSSPRLPSAQPLHRAGGRTPTPTALGPLHVPGSTSSLSHSSALPAQAVQAQGPSLWALVSADPDPEGPPPHLLQARLSARVRARTSSSRKPGRPHRSRPALRGGRARPAPGRCSLGAEWTGASQQTQVLLRKTSWGLGCVCMHTLVAACVCAHVRAPVHIRGCVHVCAPVCTDTWGVPSRACVCLCWGWGTQR